jgi:putative DNA primase/helicase
MPDDAMENIIRLAAATPAPLPPDAALPQTEDEAALEFSSRHAEELRYVNAWHKWMRWRGARWLVVETLWVFHEVRLITRELAKLYKDRKLGKDAATAAVERLARNDPRHDTPSDAWDLDLQFFNLATKQES